jgi:hypothetical protein
MPRARTHGHEPDLLGPASGWRVAGRESEGVSEFVGVLRAEERLTDRTRSRRSPTQAAIRSSHTLTRPLTRTLADPRGPNRLRLLGANLG